MVPPRVTGYKVGWQIANSTFKGLPKVAAWAFAGEADPAMV